MDPWVQVADFIQADVSIWARAFYAQVIAGSLPNGSSKVDDRNEWLRVTLSPWLEQLPTHVVLKVLGWAEPSVTKQLKIVPEAVHPEEVIRYHVSRSHGLLYLFAPAAALQAQPSTFSAAASSVQWLRLHDADGSNAADCHAAECLAHMPHLERLSLQGSNRDIAQQCLKTTSQLTALTRLDVLLSSRFGSIATNAHADPHMLRRVQDLPHLRSLSLRTKRIGRDVVSDFEGFSQLTALSALELGDLMLFFPATVQFCGVLASLRLSELTLLGHLHESSPPEPHESPAVDTALWAAVTQMPLLTQLHLDHLHVDFRATESSLMHTVSTLTALRSLRLPAVQPHWNSASVAAAWRVVTALRHLRHLEVAAKPRSSPKMPRFDLSCLTSLPHLERLGFQQCALRPSGVASGVLPTVTRLSLWRCKFLVPAGVATGPWWLNPLDSSALWKDPESSETFQEPWLDGHAVPHMHQVRALVLSIICSRYEDPAQPCATGQPRIDAQGHVVSTAAAAALPCVTEQQRIDAQGHAVSTAAAAVLPCATEQQRIAAQGHAVSAAAAAALPCATGQQRIAASSHAAETVADCACAVAQQCAGTYTAEIRRAVEAHARGVHGTSAVEAPARGVHGTSAVEAPARGAHGTSAVEAPARGAHGTSEVEAHARGVHGTSAVEAPARGVHGISAQSDTPVALVHSHVPAACALPIAALSSLTSLEFVASVGQPMRCFLTLFAQVRSCPPAHLVVLSVRVLLESGFEATNADAISAMQYVADALPAVPALERFCLKAPWLQGSSNPPAWAEVLRPLRGCVHGLRRLTEFVLILAQVQFNFREDSTEGWPEELLQALVAKPSLQQVCLFPSVAGGRYRWLMVLMQLGCRNVVDY